MKKVVLFTILCLVTILHVQAQNNLPPTPYYWFFGQNTGYNFKKYVVYQYKYNSTYHLLPSAVTSAENKFNSSVYNSVVTDNDGNVIFYTDGATVYNQNNEISGKLNITPLSGATFANGMLTLIVPIRNKEGYYYIIVNNSPLKTSSGPGNIYYAVYNVNANGGNGGFESVDANGYGVTNTLTGNIYVYNKDNVEAGKLSPALGVTSGMAIISTPSNEYWLVDYVVGNIMAWKIGNKGIDPTPVVSYVNKSSSLTNTSRDEYKPSALRFTPDGKKLLMIEFGSNSTPVFKLDFDVNTGKASNLITRSYGSIIIGQPAALEVSSNGKNVFLAGIGGGLSWGLKVMNINDYAVNTKYTSISNGSATAIQLASDGRMYTSQNTNNVIGYVENPDEPDFSKIKFQSLIYEDMGIGSQYLPVLDARGLGAKVFTTCANSNISLSFSNDYPATIVSINWNFGDGSSQLVTGVNTNDPEFSINHIYKTPGQYTVQALVSHNTGAVITKTLVVNVEDCSSYAQLTACTGYSIPLSTNLDTSDLSSVVWDFGDGSKTESELIDTPAGMKTFTKNHKYALAGQYLATIEGFLNDGSIVSTKVVVKVNDCSQTTTATRCIDEPITISVDDVPATATQIKWDFNDGTTATEAINSTGIYTQTHSYSSPGIYTVNIQAIEADGSAIAFAAAEVTVDDCVKNIIVNPTIRVKLKP